MKNELICGKDIYSDIREKNEVEEHVNQFELNGVLIIKSLLIHPRGLIGIGPDAIRIFEQLIKNARLY